MAKIILGGRENVIVFGNTDNSIPRGTDLPKGRQLYDPQHNRSYKVIGSSTHAVIVHEVSGSEAVDASKAVPFEETPDHQFLARRNRITGRFQRSG